MFVKSYSLSCAYVRVQWPAELFLLALTQTVTCLPKPAHTSYSAGCFAYVSQSQFHPGILLQVLRMSQSHGTIHSLSDKSWLANASTASPM